MTSEPAWFADIFPDPIPHHEGEISIIAGRPFIRRGGLLREEAKTSSAQQQTEKTFGFKWQKRDTFESPAALKRTREWLIERYGDVANADWLRSAGIPPIVLDAGCGAGLSGLELFREALSRIRYVGADISEAADVAAERFRQQGFSGVFFQADIMNLPLKSKSVDAIFSEGVLHHTDDPLHAMKSLCRTLKQGGRFLFYVYKRKGPIREFTDDFIREKLRDVSPQEGWDKLMPLTRLGKVLGDLQLQIDVPDQIDLLHIPKGRIDIQRLFYWHVFKAFYRADFTEEEMNHINFDWFAPTNAHRQSPEQVRAWCTECGLVIEREVIEDAGITIIARLQG